VSVRAILVLVAASLILASGVTSAHRLYIKHKIGTVEIEAFFGGGTPCRDAAVRVYDDAGNLLLEGKTDEDGKFNFTPVIGIASYKVVVEATHMPGHRAETVINLTATGAAEGGEGAAAFPLYARVIAGLGWLMGLAGAAMLYIGWRYKREFEGRVKSEGGETAQREV